MSVCLKCQNCGEPIRPCRPWGWHHADGPVLCRNESTDEATPEQVAALIEMEEKNGPK